MPAFHIPGPARVAGALNGAIMVETETGRDLFAVPIDGNLLEAERTAEFAASAYTLVDASPRMDDRELRAACNRAVAL